LAPSPAADAHSTNQPSSKLPTWQALTMKPRTSAGGASSPRHPFPTLPLFLLGVPSPFPCLL
jgi:hypothetical protein